MGDPFLAEIRIMAFTYPPRGWAFTNGQLLPINQNQALFALLGTTYGGNGQTNFALPDFRGRTPIHFGDGHTLGEAAGAPAVTLTMQQMPAHTHFLQGTTAAAGTANPSGAVLAPANNLYQAPSNLATMNPGSVTNTGGSQPHENMQPYLTLSFCIALQGIFPSRN